LGGSPAPTAEKLMRSRFTAFVKGDMGYIGRTQREPLGTDNEKGESSALVEWVDLRVVETTDGGIGEQFGTVEFEARFRQDGGLQVHHEISNFRREDGRWLYIDGIVMPQQRLPQVGKIGRNDLCSCGSGKKFKKCCGS